jgi:hypothetical protein
LPHKAWRNRDGGVPVGTFDLSRQMCQNVRVTNTSIFLRLLLIAGLIVSPLYPRVFDADAMAMSATMHPCPDGMSTCPDMDNKAAPCHDGKMDCDKACMAACIALSVQCLPSIASTPVRFVVVGQRFAVSSEPELANLAAPPPARPPRA